MPEAMNRGFLLPVLFAVVVAYLPHVVRVPFWITLFAFGCWTYILLAAFKEWPLPSKRLRHTITILAAGTALAFSWRGVGLETGVALLSVMLALKPMELNSRRDAMATLFFTCYLIIFNLFFDQGIASALYCFLTLLVFGTVLALVSHPSTGLRGSMRLCLRLLLQGAPLALALFVFFPRLPGGIFGYQARQSETGFSENMSPGDVSDLALNQDVAFRVTFPDEFPPRAKRYWRGLVLWNFNGRSWTVERDMPEMRRTILGSEPISYTVTLEPHGKRWMFALDMPISTTGGAVLLHDRTLRSRFDLRSRRRYDMSSFMTYNTGELPHWERRLTLHLPKDGNPRSRALAKELRAKSGSDTAYALALLDMFHDQPFRYTLSPQVLGEDTVDDFLFRTREGFCEHYASAMAFMLRAAGVPARVVIGYLGGRENPLGEYLIVRQSDAHAWNEVWLEGRGWVRVDPTASVAPERVERGLYAALSGQQGFEGTFADLRERYGLLRSMVQVWDATNYYWGALVLDYSFYRQRNILYRLGLNLRSLKGVLTVGGMAVGAIGLGVLILVFWRNWEHLAALWMRQRGKDPEARAKRAYDRYCRNMARIGVPRSPWEGPMDFAARIGQERPNQGETAREISQLYARTRYAPDPDMDALRRLERLARGRG